MTTLEKLEKIQDGEEMPLDAADAKVLIELVQSSRAFVEAHWSDMAPSGQRLIARAVEADLRAVGKVQP